MPRLLRASLLVAALFVAACDGPAYFQTPISGPGQVRYDQRLIGSWYGFGDSDDVWLVHILRPEEEGQVHPRAVLSFTSSEPGAIWCFAEAYASEIDGVVYYNTRLTGAAIIEMSDDSDQIGTKVVGELEGFMIIQAEVDVDDQLSLAIISRKIPRKLGLKFRDMTCGEDCDEILYELPSEALVELIRSTPRDELFGIYLGPFARIETGRPVLSHEPPPEQ